ncbi:MAG: hypothetical protein MJZ66_10260 [Bacteroidales bacterium]|nr:hypothetical protein [Bacteroidales bacterium]MCQ2253457.1 hypothetical protein [Bacteroidales bacterium]
MKIKALVFIMALLAICGEVKAQYKATKETYKIGVMGLPKYYFRPENRTYGIDVKNSVPNLVNDSYVSLGIDLPGWQETEPWDANVVITITLPGLQKMSTIWKDSPTEDHRPNGDIFVHHHWQATLCFVFTAKAMIKTSLESAECRSVPANQEYQKIPVSGTFDSKAEADKYINENLSKINKDVVKDNCNALLEEISKAMTRFVPGPKTEEISISYLLEPNCPFLPMMKDAYAHLPQELSKITAEGSLDNIKPGIQTWINKFKDAADKLSDTKAEESKAKEELLKNITVLAYVIEDFNTTNTYAQILKDTFKSKAGEKYLRLVKQAQSDLTRHKMTTRHFSLY